MSSPPSSRPAVPPELTRGYLTADLPPIPGEARVEPEDFVVEEVPLYEASGEGEHLVSQDDAFRLTEVCLKARAAAETGNWTDL